MTELGKRILKAAMHFHNGGPPHGWQVQLCEWLSQESGEKVGQQALSWALHRGEKTNLTPLIAKRYGVDAVWLMSGKGHMLPKGNTGIAEPDIVGSYAARGTTSPINPGEDLTAEEQELIAAFRLMTESERKDTCTQAKHVLHRELVGRYMRGEVALMPPPAKVAKRK